MVLTLGALGVALGLMAVSWQILKGLFTPAAPPPIVTDLETPPVVIPSPTPEVVITPAIPPAWVGTTQVRILSSDGVRIREQPNVQSRALGTALFQEVVPVVEIELGTDTIPVWLRIEHPRQGRGWIAAQIDARPLVEKVP
ncbi:MAG: hypothetical protein OHK0012_27160 [Synechococcales cyanobacterium]